MLINIPYCLGFVMISTAPSITVLFLANFLLGTTIGVTEAPINSYFGEICQPELRSILAGSAGTTLTACSLCSTNCCGLHVCTVLCWMCCRDLLPDRDVRALCTRQPHNLEDYRGSLNCHPCCDIVAAHPGKKEAVFCITKPTRSPNVLTTQVNSVPMQPANNRNYSIHILI